jgi:fructokinase
MADHLDGDNLSLQNGGQLNGRHTRILVLGEVLWDVFEHSMRLGGAPLNFAAHAKKLGCDPLLVSAVGQDELGSRAVCEMAALGLNTSFLQRTADAATGTALVELAAGNGTRFVISRPAAYDFIRLSGEQTKQLEEWRPAWLYYGTLLSHLPQGRSILERFLGALNSCSKFCDLNLRPGYDSGLVKQLLAAADTVKLNEDELDAVRSMTGLPSDLEAFCREGSARYGWQAVCVTLGARGCAMLHGDAYAEAKGCAVDVADTVGAGDAFAAAFLHGIISHWPVARIAGFANRVGALVASRHGAIPDWTVAEVVE